ncbi:hypothetical protein D3C72_1662710 [compost metagenome]
MAGLARVDIEGRGAGGGQRGGDLARHMAGFAHPGGHYPALALQHQLAGLAEGIAQPVGHRGQGVGLDLEDAAAAGDQCRGVGRMGEQGRYSHAGATRKSRMSAHFIRKARWTPRPSAI